MKLPVNRLEKTLDNGMRAVIIQKPGYNRSMFMLGVPAGGMNLEQAEEGQIRHYPAGCAHYLEHQMFRLDGQDVTFALAAENAKTNAFTTLQRTCYFVWTHSDPLPVLNLLLKFVQTLDVSEESIEKERGIILSEYDSYDQNPESRLYRELLEALYHDHPAKIEVLGSREEIKSITKENLEQFYAASYDPGALVFAAVSGQDPETLMSKLEEMEKAYPSQRKGRVQRLMPEEPTQVRDEYRSVPMDVELCYAGEAVKLPAADNVEQSLREDYYLSMWLDSVFSTLNEKTEAWMDQGILHAGFDSFSDVNTEYSNFMFVSSTDNPDAFYKVIDGILDEKKPMDARTFESLKIRALASVLRSLDDFEQLAYDAICGVQEGYDPLKEADLVKSLQLDDLNTWLAKADFSNRSKVLIHPMEMEEQSK